jgi:hypothetical protein
LASLKLKREGSSSGGGGLDMPVAAPFASVRVMASEYPAGQEWRAAVRGDSTGAVSGSQQWQEPAQIIICGPFP